MPQNNHSSPSEKKISDSEPLESFVKEEENPRDLAKESQDSGLIKSMTSTETAGYPNMIESRLWMKKVIDVIHGDIQSSSRNELHTEHDTQTVSSSHRTVRGSIPWSMVDDSSIVEKKDSRELNRIRDFMADTSLPATHVRGDTSATAARRRMAAKLDEFDEIFDSADKNDKSDRIK